MTSLNLASNSLEVEGAKHVADAIKDHVSALHVRFDWYHFWLTFDLTFGSTAVVYGYSYYNTTKGALASLNISDNSLGGYWDDEKEEWISDMTGIKALAAALRECK